MTTLVVTRPQPEADTWQVALQAAGWPVWVRPLIDIASIGPSDRVRACASGWLQYDAVMFVSAPAVVHGWPVLADLGLPQRCWAPGPGTARALVAQGMPAERIDAPSAQAPQFDSEALWAVVRNQVRPGHRLLLVRGTTASTVQTPQAAQGTGRDWLAAQCVAAGGQVDVCVVYQRQAPVWDASTHQQVRQHMGANSLWLFSSSEAAHNLHTLCPGADWHHTRALVTHPRIADTVRALGFGEIISSKPALPDVLSSLKSAK